LDANSIERIAKQINEDIDAKEMVIEADSDGDGYVSEAEFLRLMRRTVIKN
jgi:hypothetical protein